VGAAVGGIKTTDVEGETGYSVPPHDPAALADRLARLFSDRQSVLRLGRQAVQRASALFRWGRVAKQIASVYDEVIGAQPARLARLRRHRIAARSAKDVFPSIVMPVDFE
jgi:glycosyltransferase involved in cell wall biosynthesis